MGAAVAAVSPCPAQPAPEAKAARDQAAQQQRRMDELTKESIEALRARDYAGSEAAMRKLLELQPRNFVTLYNLACLRSVQDDTEAAGDLLRKAIENGFCDLRQLRRDPYLSTLRRTDFYRSLVDDWQKVLTARIETNLQQAREIFKGDYSVERDERLRLVYLSGVDERAASVARRELARLAEWADREVMPGILDPDELLEDPWVLIVLPSRKDFRRWAVSLFGANADGGFASVGGSYEHDLKRLVTQDLGASLRHEFLHVLHWRSCTRLGQTHAMWVQEGLCSLVEDYDLVADGPGADPQVRPATSWRTNMVKRMDRARNLFTIQQLTEKSHADFNGSRRLGLYAHARAVFLFLSEQRKLRDWYATYTNDFANDPTGAKSLESVFGKDLKSIDADFKAWLRDLPDVPEESHPGMASLGLTVDAGDGEGPVVSGVPLPSKRRVGLIPGDVITAIDDRSVRDLPELLRLLGQRQPGDEVEITYRRADLYGAEKLTLVRRGE